MTAEQANFYLQGQKYDDALLGVVGSWVVGEGLPIHNSWVINMYNSITPQKQADKLRTSNLWQCMGKQHPLHAGRHSSMLFKGCSKPDAIDCPRFTIFCSNVDVL